MQASAVSACRGVAHPAQAAIESFLETSREPVLFEPGEQCIPLKPGNFALSLRAGKLMLEAWSEARNLARRVTGVTGDARGRLSLSVERFGRRAGTLLLVDRASPRHHSLDRRSARLQFRESFRQLLFREFPNYRVQELSAEADLEHSLSPAYPRAFLRQGSRGWAAMAAPPEAGDPAGIVSFGLIWLDYLRRREPRVAVEGVALFLPAGQQRNACLRLLWLDPARAQYRVYTWDENGVSRPEDPADQGNLVTGLERFRGRLTGAPPSAYSPEARLEAQVRARIERLDAWLYPEPVYGQVPAIAGACRGVIDLVACDRSGRLAVIELKASADIHLPLQALDYWMRVKWYLAEFGARGYFPGIPLRSEAPRLLLVAPALEFHPANETILGYFSPRVEVEVLGIGIEWQRELKVMFRRSGGSPCRSTFSARSGRPSPT